MNLGVIVNPVAGVGWHPRRARQRVEEARDLIHAYWAPRASGARAEILVTERAGHAFELAAGLVDRGVRSVLVWGGDGTINEVGAALAFHDVSLGIVPVGSGNGLARELNLRRQPRHAIAAALHGRDRRIDAGELGGRLFFNVAGIGLDAHIARLVNAGTRRGPLSYWTATLRAVVSYTPADYTIRSEEGTSQLRALVVVLANSRQYGNGAIIAPAARIDDGRLELVLVEARPAVAGLWQSRRLFTGSVQRAPGVLTRRVEQVAILSDRPIRFHVDGEEGEGGSTLSGCVHPAALRVKVPS